MLNNSERENLERNLLEAHKKVMKDILSDIRMALDDSRFDHFRKETFNYFGKSGLETETKTILDEFTEK